MTRTANWRRLAGVMAAGWELEHVEEGTRFPLRSGSTVLVGREPTCDVRLVHATVTRRHCELVVGEAGLELTAHPAGQTSVNGTVVRRASLREGDRLLVGQVLLRVRRAAEPQEGAWTLENLDDGARFRLELGTVVIVGRALEAEVRLCDISVARRHCELVVGIDEVTATDLGSASGIWVNDRQARGPTRVRAGELLQVGGVRLRLLRPGPAPGARNRGG